MTQEIVVGVSSAAVQQPAPLEAENRVCFVPWHKTKGVEILWRRHGDSTKDLVSAVSTSGAVRWIHLDNVGVEKLPLTAWRDQRIRVSNGRGLNSVQIAEWILGATLLAVRRLDATVRLSDACKWERGAEQVTTLHGRRVVLLGVGSIGKRVAELMKPFGAHITGVVGSQPSPQDTRHQVVDRLIALDQFAEACDGAELLVICAPVTEKTRGAVSGAILDKLSDIAWVVNAARGEIIDEQALTDAVQNGWLGGAVLDVATQEPPAADCPLWGHPSIVLSAHLADHPRADRQQAGALFHSELQRYMHGEKLENEVDLEKGY